VVTAIEYPLARGKKVMVVGQPYIADVHVEQQAALETAIRERFGQDPRVRVVNLGRVLDLRDRTLSSDGMHLTAAGNRRIAEALRPAVLGMLP
jgi:hypothetical protein